LLLLSVFLLGHATASTSFQDNIFDNFNHQITITNYPNYYGGGACGLVVDAASNVTGYVAISWPNNGYFAYCGSCFSFTGPNSNTALAKVFDWGQSGSNIYNGNAWVLNAFPGNSPWNVIGCSGGTCKVTVQLQTCQNTGDIELDFDKYNNGYTILVNPRNQNAAFYKCSHNDTTSGNINWMTHTQAAYVLGNYHVVLPFTLTFYTIVGEVITYEITGLPGVPGGWPSANLNTTVTIATNKQTTLGYPGTPGGSTGSLSAGSQPSSTDRGHSYAQEVLLNFMEAIL